MCVYVCAYQSILKSNISISNDYKFDNGNKICMTLHLLMNTSFTFAGDMVSTELIAALSKAIHLAVVLENLSCGLIVPLHTLQIICQPLTP